jgi:hypothetical protein
MSNVLENVRAGEADPKEQRRLSQTTIGEWADFWNSHGEPPPGFHALQGLPQAVQKRIAAGFELIARKPGVRSQ